ncbi:coproporphyrinogen dehydrogenase HemZ [Peptostreptococcus equinus]|uniref:Coproporphyrinogen dehydrogenase HemZ n=1 Tax=Peptostreptococcus equinus TaxID=3003601 RepID=A0ABY7JQE1_9FIRM|nr:coproporphyrinogen dehydrogenase HemZ [Peptostreptococcus sp. CBA3647]WAW15567.1 coproporphyrinogen dehydrogenase HemZ [Peptostreptococcus sp. CBA3647]
MIKILLQGHDYKYEIAEFLKLFTSEFSFIDGSEDFDVINQVDILMSQLYIGKTDQKIRVSATSQVISDGEILFNNSIEEEYLLEEKKFAKNNKKIDNIVKTMSKRVIQKSMYPYFVDKYKIDLPWGILTGIRPVKKIHSLLDEGMDYEEIGKFMIDKYLISEEKLELILNIAKRERKFIYPLSENKISMYVSIPFCPSRCVYCSFPSNTLSEFGDVRDKYIEKLLWEIEGTHRQIMEGKKEIETLYIGGGTPTSLEAKQLDRLMSGLKNILDFTNIKEFTVEAGRPDTIDEEKLLVLKNHKVSRISINPQSMNEDTLLKIGRKHSVDDIKSVFKLARKMGFDNINMDLILGLPGEDPNMVKNTIKEILELNPENITVHTLALKRTSEISMNIEKYREGFTDYNNMVDMISICKEELSKNGYNPYYMYRQKHMLGNLENIGYSKKGFECLYNMQIMEERQTNMAFGAGAVSKFVYLDEDRLERVDDVKNLEIYLERVDDMINKKIREVRKNGD